MAFPPSFIDELIARNPIEDVVGQYVSLKRSGSNLFGLCPFHGEKTASFSVAPDKGIYYCFGCHKGGGVVNFMMEVEGLSYPDAVRALAKRAGMEVPEDEQYQSRYRKQERLWALMKEAGRFYHSQLYAPVGAECLAYVQKRGLSKSIVTRFGIGFAPNSWNALVDAMKKKGYTDEELKDADLVGEKNGRIYDRFRNRLMFPIFDVRGNVIGFGGRVLDDSKPKYLNTSETLIFNKRKNLFGLNFAKKTKLDYMILVEGNIDVVALHQYGFDCAVASLGTSLTEEHAALLSRYTEQVVLTYDSDEAGQRAAQRAIPMLEKAGIQVKVLQIRDAKDPDEYLKKFGADKFKLLLEESSNRVEYQLNAVARKYEMKDDEQRIRFIHEAAELISTLGSAVQREIYGHRVAETGKISFEAMKLEIDKAFKRRIAREKKKQEKIDLAPAQAMQPKSRSIRYVNMKSAMAEETVIAMVLKEPALLDQAKELKPAAFSSALLGKVYGQLKQRHEQGLEVSLAVLEDCTAEEISHVTGVLQRQQGPVNEAALADCIRTIRAEHQLAGVSTEDDLLALRNQLKERKGIKA
ncbi:MAG: DNA primase [Oscillospiraceae bacterium]|nr:DNA primase [Oscillospiraceae bacterium]